MESRCKLRSMETQWPRTRQAALKCSEPHWAPTSAAFLGGLMCFQTYWGYWVEGPVLMDGTKSHKSAHLGSSSSHHHQRAKYFFLARREIWHGQNLFSHRHYRSRAVPLFPPHLKRRASAPPSVFPPFCLSKVSHQLEAFLTGQSLKHSNKLHWPTALPPTPCSKSRAYFKLLKIHTPSFIMR